MTHTQELFAALKNAGEFLIFYHIGEKSQKNRANEGNCNMKAEAMVALDRINRALDKLK